MDLEVDDLYWKDHIIEKIIQNHAVTPEEVEEVIFEGHPEVRKHAENRFLIFGQTQSGRYLFIVIEEESKRIYVPITARDMTDKEKRAFRKRQAKKNP